MEVGRKMVNLLAGDGDTGILKFEETELRLGLPLPGGGGGGGGVASTESGDAGKNVNGNGKRGFAETGVDLNLNLFSMETTSSEILNHPSDQNSANSAKNLLASSNDIAKPPAKAQVVGWPPVRSFRKNILAVQKSNGESEKSAFVKVSIDGAPFLRKVDLKTYHTYHDLSHALASMFSCFTLIGNNCGSQGISKDFMSESKLMDLLNTSDYVPTYQDNDGDWMLIGDVPWEMFVSSCKRLHIMKGTEAIGLAPKAMEKCKNRR